MMNLFSVFDPSSYFGISLNWLIMLIVFMMIPLKYYFINGESNLIMKFLSQSVSQTFQDVGSDKYLAVSFICVTTFLYLMLSNLLGLFPFIFTSTAHPKVALGLGFIMWLTFFLMGWTKNFKESSAHLVPEGSPLMLAPLMVLIESISHLIRPFTLSIRLAANMMAGHLIIGLLSSISSISLFGFSSSLFFQNVLLLLEFGVSVIQGFVFSILLLLYALEYY